jgi:protein-disulfide isomerase
VSREPEPPLTRRDRRALERRERPIRDRSRPSTRRRKRPVWQSPFVLVSAAALVVAAAIIVLNQKPAPSTTGANLFTPPITYSADILDGEGLGRADAPVVLEVYSDFQCPICARFVREQWATLKSEVVDTGILRIQARDIAIVGTGNPNESIELAVGAACAAKQDKYWQFHDLVFWNQGGENRGDHSPAFIAAVADRAGVDRTAWDECFADDQERSAIQSQTQIALGKGINSTPTLVLNGSTPVPGIPDANQLIAAVKSLAGAAGSPTPEATLAP